MAGQTITAVIAADARPFKKGMSDASNSTAMLTKSLKTVAAGGALAFAALAAGAVAFGLEAIKAADKSRQVSRSLGVAVKNSGAFGKSADNIAKVTSALDDASTKLGELIGLDDELISGIKRNWLSVPRIAATGIKGINKLAQTAADVAAGTGKNFEEVATAFTKAYGDPKGAIAKLQRAGVILSDQDKARYQSLIDQGKKTEALAFLTDTLAKKYKGQAEAAASPFARLEVSLQNFQEKIGLAFLPLADKILPGLQQALTDLVSNPKFQKSLEDISTNLGDLIPTFLDFVQASLPILVSSLRTIADFLKPITDWFAAVGGAPQTKALQRTGQSGLAAIDAAAYGVRQSVINQQGLTQISPGTVNININSLVPSAAGGKAAVDAIAEYYRRGGRRIAFSGDTYRGPGR